MYQLMFQLNPINNIPLTSQIFLKPEYQIHPKVSGNKFRKLKYNLAYYDEHNFKGLLTFGGAFSNHIAATAAAGQALNIPTIGIIRGEELAQTTTLNPTLEYAKSCGMNLKFISRKSYRKKNTPEFLAQLRLNFPDVFVLPEGGTNALAVQGCQEILSEHDTEFDIICCAVGTGGTISGLINSSRPSQKIIGFPALKGSFLSQDICKFATQSNWELCQDYHFGGYAKLNPKLIEFMNSFKRHFGIPLDPIYTAKMMYGIFDLIEKGKISSTAKVLAIHSGGLQSIKGMNQRLKDQQLPAIL